MKKTIIALLALAGVSLADTTYSPLASSDGWIDGAARSGKTNVPSLDIEEAALTMTNSNWSCGYAICDLSDITLSHESDTLSVTFSLSSSLVDSVVTGALISTNKAIVMGHGAYNGTQDSNTGALTATINGIQVGDSTTVSNNFYHLHQSSTPGVYVERDYTSANDAFLSNTAYTFTTRVAWDKTRAQFVANVMQGGTSLITYDLGDTYTLDKLAFSMDCGATGTQKVSSVSVVANIVPEPTTATLSLLALAGLAARRRRK